MVLTGSALLRRIILTVVLIMLLKLDYSSIYQAIKQNISVGSSLINEANQKRRLPQSSMDNDNKMSMLATIKNACLPKLICELNATPNKEKLSDAEKSLLTLLRDTSISTTTELTSKYHFAAHMGQLIAGIEGNGCHHFYPTCPFPGVQVLKLMRRSRIRNT